MKTEANKSAAAKQREARAAEKLRDNLRRRKAQERARNAGDGKGDGPKAE